MLFLYLPSGMTLQTGKHKNHVILPSHRARYGFIWECEHLNISRVAVIIPTLTFLEGSNNFRDINVFFPVEGVMRRE